MWVGGTPSNQAWYEWFCQINQQAYHGALDEAAFSVIRTHWPETYCTDYDLFRSDQMGIRTYSGSLGTKGCNYPVNAFFRGYENETFGEPTTQNPTAARILNTPHLYSDVSGYHWAKWTRQHENNPWLQPWANTDDEDSPAFGPRNANGRAAPYSDRGTVETQNGIDLLIGSDDEFWEESSMRFNRWTLDGMVRKLTEPVGTVNQSAAWIALPHQPLYMDAPQRSFSPNIWRYNGLGYSYSTLPMRQSVYATYRTLADARARGITEFIVWNDTGPDAEPGFVDSTSTTIQNFGVWGNREGFYLNRGVHPDWPKNWDLLRQSVEHVFNYDCTVENAVGGTISAPTGLEQAAIRYADDVANGAGIAGRSVRIESTLASTLKRTGLELRFTPRVDTGPVSLGTSINLSLRAAPYYTQNVTPETPGPMLGVQVYVHRPDNTGYWRELGSNNMSADDPSTTVDSDGLYLAGGGFTAELAHFSSLRTRIPYSRMSIADEREGILDANGQLLLRVTMRFPAGTALTHAPIILIDHAAVYLSDEVYRDANGVAGHAFLLPGDLNADGAVNEQDDALFNHLLTPVANPDDAPKYSIFADFDHNGVLSDSVDPNNPGDKYLWRRDANTPHSIYNYGRNIFTTTTIADPLNAKRYDVYRQSAIENPHPCPACTADVGIQGGSVGTDCVLDNNDFIAYIDLFFSQAAAADIGSQGGVSGPDGTFDNNDFVVFIDAFFMGCN